MFKNKQTYNQLTSVILFILVGLFFYLVMEYAKYGNFPDRFDTVGKVSAADLATILIILQNGMNNKGIGTPVGFYWFRPIASTPLLLNTANQNEVIILLEVLDFYSLDFAIANFDFGSNQEAIKPNAMPSTPLYTQLKDMGTYVIGHDNKIVNYDFCKKDAKIDIGGLGLIKLPNGQTCVKKPIYNRVAYYDMKDMNDLQINFKDLIDKTSLTRFRLLVYITNMKNKKIEISYNGKLSAKLLKEQQEQQEQQQTKSPSQINATG